MAGASGIRAGGAWVEIGAVLTGLQKGLDSAAGMLKGFGAGIAAIGGITAGLEAVIKGSFLYAAKTFADTGSSLNDMSSRTGLSVEALSSLGFAASMTGKDMSSVEGGFKKFQKTLLKGSQENLAAESTFAALGLSVDKLSGMTPDEQFNRVADAIRAIEDPSKQAGVAMELFGKSGADLLPMIKDLDALTGQAKEFGLVWTGEEAAKADALGDSIDLLKATMMRVVTTVGGALAPMLTELAGKLAGATKQVIDLVKANQPLVILAFEVTTGLFAAGTALVALGSTVWGVGKGLNILSSALGAVYTVLGAVGSVFAFLVTGPGLVVTGLIALSAWFLTATDSGKSLVSTLGGAFSDLWGTATEAFDGIANALAAGDISLAAEILWAALKLEWVKGTTFLSGLWHSWTDGLTGAFSDATASIMATLGPWISSIGDMFSSIWSTVSPILSKGWDMVKGVFTSGIQFVSDLWKYLPSIVIDTWAMIQTSFVKALDFMVIGFSDFVATISKMWNNFSGFFSEVWARIKNLFTGVDIEAEIARIRDATAKANAEADAKAASVPTSKDKIAQIEKERVDAQAALASGMDVDAAAKARQAKDREAAATAAAASAAIDVQAAQSELGDATDKAALLGALNRQGSKLPEDMGKAPPLTPDTLDRGIDITKTKVDVAGTFSASALQGFGAGESVAKVADDQLKEQKEANKHLVAIRKASEKKEKGFT